MTILLCSDIDQQHLGQLLARYGMQVSRVEQGQPIPGSFWQPPEAGLVGNTLYIRDDTPVHSALHEACHYICMDRQRRESLDTDAGGGYEEENGVCYLQVLLSEHIAEMGRQRMFSDMDEWGYSFRLGSSSAWFSHDADDAVHWLIKYGIIDEQHQPTFRLRH
ncbi:MAG: hypothetical protein HKO86_05380 [Gammaproteobacteria bacterium]|nr:hypothetical protein [Gammaproteobacteria bacterium]